MLDDDLDEIHPLFAGAPATTEFKKLRKRIVRYAREAIDQYTGTSSGVTIHSCNAAMHMDLFDEPVHGDAVGMYQMTSDYEIVHSETAL